MVKFKERTLDDKVITYVAGTPVSIDLPRDKYFQKVMLRASFTTTTAPTVVHEDGVINMLSNVRLVSDSKDVHFDCSGYDIYAYNKNMYMVTPRNDSPAGTATYIGEISLDLMRNPKDNNDISAMVNARAKSSFVLTVLFNTAAGIGTGAPVISAGSITVTIREAELTPEDISRQGAFYTVFHGVKQEIYTATSSEYLTGINLPVSRILDYVGIATRITATGIRGDTVLSKYKLEQSSPISDEIVKVGWYESKAQDQRDYEQEAVLTGYTSIDLRADFGTLDARALKDGDIKFSFNVAVVGTVRLFVKSAL